MSRRGFWNFCSDSPWVVVVAIFAIAHMFSSVAESFGTAPIRHCDCAQECK